MYTADGIVIIIRILYYLSEVVVLKLAGAVLNLECRLLDMRTGAPDSGEVSMDEQAEMLQVSG